jgi:DNA-binding GntR family transcriptional regulator
MITALPVTLLDRFQPGRSGDGLLRQQAYDHLKQKIINLTFAPASLFREADLVAELGLGRTPIREALQRLAFEKLVLILPRIGILVTDLNEHDLWNILDICLELEPCAVRLAATRASAEQTMEINSFGTVLAGEATGSDIYELIWLEYWAHRLLAQATYNQFLDGTLAWLYAHLTRWRFFLHPDPAGKVTERVEALRVIVDAVNASDGDLAAWLMKRHLTDVSDGFRETVGK